jgi:hypothetical protein
MHSGTKPPKIRRADNVSDFLHHVQEIYCNWFTQDDDPFVPWFRGQQEAEWQLTPKLYRGRDFEKVKADEMEDEMREEFIKRAPIMCETLPGGNERHAEWDWYFIMQHHGMATRLLDWTEGALIALYFAVRHNSGNKDAAVWVLDPYELNKRVIGKEWIIPVSATGVEPDKYVRKVEKWLPTRFKHMEGVPPKPVAIDPTHVVRRISSQHSCFTIHGRDKKGLDRLQDEESTCLVKILIPRSGVNGIKKQLRTCGINEATIFPDLDGLSRAINAKWGIGKGAEAKSGRGSK